LDWTDEDLGWALGIWKDPFHWDPETVQKATSIVRFWRTELKAEMRGVPRNTERYRTLKHKEEQLENATVDLKDAWITQLSARRHGG